MDVIDLRNKGLDLGFDLTLIYRKLTYQELVDCTNGVGPEWLPEWVRDRITDYFEYFLPSTNPHDCDFTHQPKTREEFDKANKRLYKNMKIQIKKDKNLSWWHFCKENSKWRKYLQARFLYRMCDKFGESAFFNDKAIKSSITIKKDYF